MTSYSKRKVEHTLFLFSVWIKGLAGVVETIGGVLVLFVTRNLLDSFILFLAAPELAEDSADWFVNYLSSAVQRFSEGTKYFASVYLIVHGLIKIVLVAGLLRNKLWAYPLSLWFLGAFIVYQCYRFTHTHSIWLVLLTVFDLVVAFLIWREYKWRKTHGRVIIDRKSVV
jgi:uncharacterized membrane protein